MPKIEVDIKKYIDYTIIGEKATSYKMPLVVSSISEYETNNNTIVCIDTKNINGYYIVFDKNTFIKKIKEYLED